MITGVKHYEENTILVLTYTGVLREIQLNSENNKLVVTWKDIQIDLNWKKYRAHGMFLSHNRVFFGLLIHPCQLKDMCKISKFITLVMLKNNAKKPMKLLLNNASGSLENYWDCFETLR